MQYLFGRRMNLSLQRRFVADLLYFAKRIPSIPMQRPMDLSKVVAARNQWERRPSWCALFMKAFAMVAEQRPELRRCYQPLPWPQLYEHPVSVGSVAVEREYCGENGVFVGRVWRPDTLGVTGIDAEVRRLQHTAIEEVPEFMRQLWLTRLPRPLRRFLWRMGLDWGGSGRAFFFGTFGISVTASLGAASLHQLSPLTTVLNYSPFYDDDTIDVRLTYDHRVFDGATTARALKDIEDVMNNVIVEELLAGPPSADVADAA